MESPSRKSNGKRIDALALGRGERFRLTANPGGGETPIKRVATTRIELAQVVGELEERTAGMHVVVTLIKAEEVGGALTDILPVSSFADVRALLDSSV